MKTHVSINRRNFLTGTGSFAALASLGAIGLRPNLVNAATTKFEIVRSKQEWQKLLTPAQYSILRLEKTERKYSSALLKEKRVGNYHCAGCDLPTYHSSTKFDSRTGWPSFYKSIAGAIGTKEDNSFFSRRTEVHCRRCGGHFGHIFDDGPAPTGKRHCLNGLALTFKPTA